MIKRLTEDLKRALSALALSEAGELRPHWEKAALLDGRLPAPTVPSAQAASHESRESAPQRAEREIALCCGGGPPSDAAVDYVIGLCRRLEAGLVLLTRKAPEPAEPMPAAAASRLDGSGVPWRLARVADDSLPGIARYIRQNPQVVLMVSGGNDPLQGIAGRGRRGHLQRELPVPLVVLAQVVGRAA